MSGRHKNYIVDSLLYWVEEYHVDGFKLTGNVPLDLVAADPFLKTTKLFASDWKNVLKKSGAKETTGTKAPVNGPVSVRQKRLAEYRDDVRPGQSAAVYIKSIIPEKMKIKLIIIDSHDTEEYPDRLEYFIDTDSITHIDSWQYSPPGCKKVIESIFV